MKKIILFITIFLISLFLSCEKNADDECYIYKTQVIKYSVVECTLHTEYLPQQIDTLCLTYDKIQALEGTFVSAIDNEVITWTTKCKLN